MKITDLLKPVSIQLNVAPPKSKTEAIEILADLMEKSGNLNNKEEYLKPKIKLFIHLIKTENELKSKFVLN